MAKSQNPKTSKKRLEQIIRYQQTHKDTYWPKWYAWRQKWRDRRRAEKLAQTPLARQCVKCGEWKVIAEFMAGGRKNKDSKQAVVVRKICGACFAKHGTKLLNNWNSPKVNSPEDADKLRDELMRLQSIKTRGLSSKEGRRKSNRMRRIKYALGILDPNPLPRMEAKLANGDITQKDFDGWKASWQAQRRRAACSTAAVTSSTGAAGGWPAYPSWPNAGDSPNPTGAANPRSSKNADQT